jgi:hypothetical protein
VAVAWQAPVAAGVGIIVGMLVGIALGRWLWNLFARDIYAVPLPTVPALESSSWRSGHSSWPILWLPSRDRWRPVRPPLSSSERSESVAHPGLGFQYLVACVAYVHGNGR